jgi:hypothetical protein
MPIGMSLAWLCACGGLFLASPWQLRSVGDIEIAPLTWHFLLKDHSKLRALPAAQARWASSFVRGVSKAFKLKLDLEIPRDFGSSVLGGEIFKAILIRLCACFLSFMTTVVIKN